MSSWLRPLAVLWSLGQGLLYSFLLLIIGNKAEKMLQVTEGDIVRLYGEFDNMRVRQRGDTA